MLVSRSTQEWQAQETQRPLINLLTRTSTVALLFPHHIASATFHLFHPSLPFCRLHLELRFSDGEPGNGDQYICSLSTPHGQAGQSGILRNFFTSAWTAVCRSFPLPDSGG